MSEDAVEDPDLEQPDADTAESVGDADGSEVQDAVDSTSENGDSAESTAEVVDPETSDASAAEATDGSVADSAGDSPGDVDEASAGGTDEATSGGEDESRIDDDESTSGEDEAETGMDADESTPGEDESETTTRPPVEKIRDRIDDADPGTIAEEIATLRERAAEFELHVQDLEAERDELESKLKRKQADFENYKKRQRKRRQEERERATEDLVTRLFEVRDNLDRALETDEDADIRDGVEATCRLLDDVLEAENVTRFEPEPGDDVDPNRHEVLLRVESDRPEGTVDSVHRPGYQMAGKVLRTAQVTVSE